MSDLDFDVEATASICLAGPRVSVAVPRLISGSFASVNFSGLVDEANTGEHIGDEFPNGFRPFFVILYFISIVLETVVPSQFLRAVVVLEVVIFVVVTFSESDGQLGFSDSIFDSLSDFG